MQTLNDEGLLKADQINEKLWKEKSGWEQIGQHLVVINFGLRFELDLVAGYTKRLKQWDL